MISNEQSIIIISLHIQFELGIHVEISICVIYNIPWIHGFGTRIISELYMGCRYLNNDKILIRRINKANWVDPFTSTPALCIVYVRQESSWPTRL